MVLDLVHINIMGSVSVCPCCKRNFSKLSGWNPLGGSPAALAWVTHTVSDLDIWSKNFTQLSGRWSSRWLPVSPCGCFSSRRLMWLPYQAILGQQESESRNCKSSFSLRIQLTKCHFCCILLSEQITRARQIRGDGEVHLGGMTKSHYKEVCKHRWEESWLYFAISHKD